jgi:DNA-binding MarR family transcriptional regulator
MGLEQELSLKKGFEVLEHEAILNVYYTASLMKKQADIFFRRFGLTDVQFNVLMLLNYQTGPEGGLSQAELSNMMLVNRANITSLVDRMEKTSLVVRTSSPDDRRYNIIILTDKGRRLFEEVEPIYQKRIREIMSLLIVAQQQDLVKSLSKIRTQLR